MNFKIGTGRMSRPAGKIKFPVYDASAKWMCKYSLYSELQNDTVLKSDEPELKLFADSVSALNIGKFYNMNNMLANGNYNTGAAAATVNGISATNLVEQNLKDVYAITISNQKNEGLSNVEIKALQTIAKQCPYVGGYGVYNARVILSTADNTVYTNSCESGMAGKSGLKLAPGAGDTAGVNGIAVYPNPANDKLNIAVHLKEGEIGVFAVYDLAGKRALTATLTGSNISEVSTTLLSEGLYIYKIMVNDTPISTGKLSIIH